jgi:hypothetical protein
VSFESNCLPRKTCAGPNSFVPFPELIWNLTLSLVTE